MPYLPILASISDLVRNTPETFLSADADAADTAITVESINRITTDGLLFVGEPANEHAEIVKTHASTAPTGSVVTLASGLEFGHFNGTKVYLIDYDQVEFSHAATVDGSKTVLSTDDIDADAPETIYRDTTYTDGYYFVRFKNSISGVFSGYSDPIPHSGWADDQVGSAIQYSLERNKVGLSEKLTHEFLLQEARSCITDFLGKLKRWENLQSFDYDLGNTARGVNSFAAPADMYSFTYKSVLQFRIANRPRLIYRDKEEWDELLEDVHHTTLDGAVTSGATSLTVTNALDLADDGSIMVSGITITYTAKNNTTGVLTGIPASGDGSVTSNLSDGADVWEGKWQEGEPRYWTIFGGYLYFWPLVSARYASKNVLLDYWVEAPTVDSDADVLDLKRFDAVKHWLTWVVRSQVKYDGVRKADDTDYQQYAAIRADAISLELRVQNQRKKMKPRTNRIMF